MLASGHIPGTQIKITVCCQCNAKKGSEIARTIKSEITQFQLRFTLSIVEEQRTEKGISLAKEQTSYDDYITICAHFVGSREQISN